LLGIAGIAQRTEMTGRDLRLTTSHPGE
jgi:hypothetical protein